MTRFATLTLFVVVGLVIAGAGPSSAEAPLDAEGASALVEGTEFTGDAVVGLDGPPERVEVGTIGTDIGRSLEFSRSEVSVSIERVRLRNRLAEAPSDQARFEILQGELDSMNTRLNGLYSAEQEVLNQFSSGSISPAEYLLITAFLDARVESYLETSELIQAEGERIQAAAIGTRVEVFQTRASVVGGTIQDHVADSIAGQSDPTTVRIEANVAGYRTLMIDGEESVRQGHRYDLRGSPDQLTNDLRAALDRVYAKYPNETGNAASVSVGGQQRAGVFIVTVASGSGVEFTSFVDNRNMTVFKEVYRRPLSSISVTDIGTVTEGELQLTVYSSPTEAVILTELSRVGLDGVEGAVVRINGSVAGRTHDGGRFWIVDRTEAINLTNEIGNESVSVTVG